MEFSFLIALFTVFFFNLSIAQTDTITADNQKMTSTYNKVVGPDDWENVSITRVAKEVRGFRQLGSVSVESGGHASVNPIGAIGTVLAGNMSAIRKRVFRKMKMQCAMNGGNLIHLTQVDSTSGLYLGIGGRGAEMNGKGVYYTTLSLDAGMFRKNLKGKITFTCVEKVEMSAKDSEFIKSQFDSVFNLSYVIFESGLLYAIGTLNNVYTGQFLVIGFTDKQFILMRKVKSTIYNYVIDF